MGFRKGKGCVDHIFGLKMLVEKYPDKDRKLFADFMNLKKAYDRVEQVAGGWQCCRQIGLQGAKNTSHYTGICFTTLEINVYAPVYYIN